MPAFALTVMKFAFLALLYLFVYRAVRWFVVDMRASRVPASGAGATSGMPPVPPAAGSSAPVRRKGKAPRQLVVMDERGKKTQTVRLAGTMQIGRAEACHLRIGDSYASQYHAKLYPVDGSWFVEDLGSTNGTFLNQRKVTGPSQVIAGDRLRIGTTTLEVKG